MGKDQFPEATRVILNNTYMDDIIESVDTREKASEITGDIEKLLDKGGFKLKEWTYSGHRSSGDKTKIAMKPSAATEKVLGVVWDPIRDNFQFKVKLSFSPKRKLTLIRKDMTPADIHIPDVLTKRMIWSQVNSIYDPVLDLPARTR